MPSAEAVDSLAIVRHLYAALNAGQVTILDEHPGLARGALHLRWRHAPPVSLQATIKAVVAAGTWVAAWVTLSGAPHGRAMEGPSISAEEIVLYRVIDGVIVQHQTLTDTHLLAAFDRRRAPPHE